VLPVQSFRGALDSRTTINTEMEPPARRLGRERAMP